MVMDENCNYCKESWKRDRFII